MISFVSLTQSQTWDYLGNAGFSGTSASDSASHLSIAIDNLSQDVYVAFSAMACDGKLALTKYQGNNTWGQSIQNSNPLVSCYSTGYANFIDLNIDDNGLPYLSYLDAGAGDALKIVSQSTNGEYYVSGTHPTGAFYGGYSINTFIRKDVDNENYIISYADEVHFYGEGGLTEITPNINITALAFDYKYGNGYVAYSNLNDSGKIDIQKLNSLQSIETYDNISDGLSNYIDLAINPLTLQPYIAYQDLANEGKLSVKKLNGNNWEFVGNDGEAFSDGLVNYVDLAFSPNGAPYIAFQDATISNKLSVMTFDGNNWGYVGERGFTNSSASYCSIELNSDGEIFVAFRDGAVDNKASVMRYGSTLSLNENYLNEYSLYPNPTNNLLNVKSQELLDIKIYDGLGHLVLKNDSSNSIDVSKLSSGLYFVNIKNGSKTSIKKFIKN